MVHVIFDPLQIYFSHSRELLGPLPPDTKFKKVQWYMYYFPPYEFYSATPVRPVISSALPPGSLNRRRSLVELKFFPLRIFFSHSCTPS